MHFEGSLTNSGFHCGKQAAMVDGAQRMQATFCFADDHVSVDGHEVPQQCGGQFRHIAGDQQNPFRSTRGQGSQQAPQRTAIRNQVGDHAQTQVPVTFRRTDDSHVIHSLEDHTGNLFQQRFPSQGQQRLIATHASAAASRQHKAHVLHEKIVAVVGRNKVAVLCFALALVALAPLHAETATARKLVVRADRRTGRLVTVAIPVIAAKSKVPSANIAQMVADAAKANDIDPLLVHSVIQVESNYNPYAVSSAGARGLMQLMPGTARDLGVTDSFDPRQNIEAGVKYLKQLKDQYPDEKMALAAYNAGPGSVQKYRAVPPYPETRSYVQRVGERYVEARKAAGIAPAVALQPAAPQELPQVPEVSVVVVTEEKHARLEQFLDEYGRLHLRTAPE